MMYKNKATQSFINAGKEFEAIERILLYFKVSNFFINKDLLGSVKKLSEFNDELEVPYELNPELEKEFLQINHYENTLSTMMYIKTIDNFINYFKEILSEIVIINPNILKSKDSERLDFILSFKTFEELINAITEKKVEALFYQGIKDIQQYFKERLGIEIFKENFYQINLLVKQRNLAVHNRSKISKEFAKEFPGEFPTEGFNENLMLKFKFDYVEKLVPALYKIINDLDYKLAEKFRLNEKAY